MTDKPTLTATDIEAAAEALQAEEKRVSVATVRARLGRGSNSTIGPVLAAWRERQEKIQAAPPIPEAVSAVISKAATELWTAATEAHRAELERLKADHAGQLSNMQEDLEASEKYGTAMEVRAEDAEAEVAELRRSLDAARAEAQKAAGKADALRERAEAAERQAEAAIKALASVQERKTLKLKPSS